MALKRGGRVKGKSRIPGVPVGEVMYTRGRQL
jgi:hypothetical protein